MPRAGIWMVFGALVVAVGCGGSEDRRPDTGAGASQPVPATLNCADMCGRLADCLVTLCNEDTNSMQFTPLGSVVEAQCVSGCTDALVMTQFSTTAWQCLFQSSCRQVLDYDTCAVDSSYHCM
jgi:hypothetical protein